uniref:Uncharacterized protein n=1 Tax=Anguilla anguilla TaxID=7936 RepID=A0A0E9XDR9_ANGAN
MVWNLNLKHHRGAVESF